VPPDSFTERYQVAIAGPAGHLELETDRPSVILDAASLPAEAGQAVEIEIRMVGPMALSHPRGISLTL
jgi:hypothetical protein